jgi:hypothetical protein
LLENPGNHTQVGFPAPYFDDTRLPWGLERIAISLLQGPDNGVACYNLGTPVVNWFQALADGSKKPKFPPFSVPTPDDK